jgi:hypothetical protein
MTEFHGLVADASVAALPQHDRDLSIAILNRLTWENGKESGEGSASIQSETLHLQYGK